MVIVYVEGGGDSKGLKARCREGFSKLAERGGLKCRMPSFVSCGGREQAFVRFKIALLKDKEIVFLLVDSEEPVSVGDWSNYTSEAWDHLNARDGWERPRDAQDDQAHLMATSMETWIIADRIALRRFFPHINENALLPVSNLEDRQRDRVLDSLERATSSGGRQRQYQKGDRSFQLLAKLDPQTLRSLLPHFNRFVEALDSNLT